MVVSTSVNAQGIEVDGLRYNILSEADRTVEVGGYQSVSGNLEIPEKIVYDSETYTVTTIGNGAFSGCSGLTSVTIPNSVTTIGGTAFFGCSGLTSVTIPSSVTAIGDCALSNCNSLTEINVDAENQSYASEAGILYTKDKTILIACPGGKKGEIAIPNFVIMIGYSAFRGCSGLTSVTIPNSVTLIGGGAFDGCFGMTSVTIPSSVTLIGDFAFYDCSGLTSVTIPNSVTSIGNGAFDGCRSLKSIYCQWTEPIECNPMFSNDVYQDAVLYVPVGCTSAYKAVIPWCNFLNIEEIDYSGVEDVADDGIEVKVVAGDIVVEGYTDMEIYSINGQLMYRGSAGRVENLAPGIYVVHAGGKTVKVMVAR